MNNNMIKFVEQTESENTQKVIRHIFKKINTDDDFETYTNPMQVEQMLLDMKPNSPKDITTASYILSSYSKWLYEEGIVPNDNLCQMFRSVDKKLLWKKAKGNAKKKFLSFPEYKEIIKAIETYEEHNALYYSLLFQCIYEGIYNQDLSVLKNLRRSNIGEGVVTLIEDNKHSYKIKVPEKLCADLIKLSDIHTWYRNNRFGVCSVDMRGVFPDSTFKIESRNTNSDGSYRFTYYSKLRKINTEYVGHSVSPLNLYISGLMYRIKTELNKNNISLKEAFSDNNRNKLSHLIIQKELIRCNSEMNIGNFRELVKGHLDVF